MPDFLALVGGLAGFVAIVAFIVGFLADSSRVTTYAIRWGIIAGLVCALAGAALFGAGAHWAGPGDAHKFAQEWVDKWHPNDSAQIECQGRDTDDNGYVTCTVGWKDPDGATQLEAIECGVNRWFHGYNITGCRLMKGSWGNTRN